MDPGRSNSAAVGIDLGTSNTVVAQAGDLGARAIADDVTKDVLVPSVCAFHPSGAVVVGREAKARRLQDPKNTVFSTKRLIGRPWGSKEVAQARARLPYELREGKNSSVLVVARSKPYTLPEISAFVLRKAKAIAEVSVRGPVDRAVITCPANFDDLQRGATKLAGQLAGLEVLRVLNEPTAAALAYGYGKDGEETILVYDFGGGTFDVTVLARRGDLFHVRATAGDSFLGGDDIDAAIADRIAEGFAAKHFYDPRADRQVFEHVRDAAEKLKVLLTREERATIELADVAFGVGGKSLGLAFEMTQGELGQIVDPFIDKTFKVCRKALASANVDVRGIDQVLLVGGSTLIARVRERVAELFVREPAEGVSPFEAVAVGAAIQAHAMTVAADDDDGEPTEAALAAARRFAASRAAPPAPVGARPAFAPTPAGSPAPVSAFTSAAAPPANIVLERPPSIAPSRARVGWVVGALVFVAVLLAWFLAR